MKTQCPHCQTKFKTSDGVTGKKINCPKCNQPFVISSLIKDNKVEVCSNCGKEIGRLQQACVFSDKIVCAECDKKLRGVVEENLNKAANEYQWQQGSSQDSQEPKLKEENLRQLILAEKKEYNIKSFCWGIPGFILQLVCLIFIMIRIGEIFETQTYDASDQIALGLLRVLLLLGSIAFLIGIVYYTKYLNRHWAWSLFAFVPFGIGIIVLLFLKDKTEQLYPTAVSVSEEMTTAKTSKLALASLILGFLGIVTIITAIPGLICGILAITEISKRPGVLKGRFLAIAGTVISALICLLFLMSLLSLLASMILPARR
jgi:predicted Zn finger-like uncharacterized protein